MTVDLTTNLNEKTELQHDGLLVGGEFAIKELKAMEPTVE